MGVGRSLQSFELELESISQIITHAFDTLREGKAPVLNDLSDRIDRLCRFKVKNARDSAHGNVL